jgi:hypothetical protein
MFNRHGTWVRAMIRWMSGSNPPTIHAHPACYAAD